MPYVIGGLAAVFVGVVARIVHLVRKHTRKKGAYSFFICLRRPLFFRQRQGDIPRPGAGNVLAFASGGLFSFSSERKEEKKRRQKLRFWISLRGFT